METHRRWFCRECKREWLQPQACYANSSPCSITGNPLNGPNCQVCGSPEIELVEYKPNYPGLDIPRDQPNKIIESEIISVIPGNVAANNYNFRNEPLLGREAKELIPKVPEQLLGKDNEPDPFRWTVPDSDDIKAENEFQSEARDSGIYDNSDMD